MKKVKTFWESLVSAGAAGSPGKLIACRSINLLAVIIILLNVIAGPLLYLLIQKPVILAGSLLESVLMAVVIVLNRSRRHRAATWVLFAGLYVVGGYFAIVFGKDTYASIMMLFWMAMTGLFFGGFIYMSQRMVADMEASQESLEQQMVRALHANDQKKNFIRDFVHEIKSGFNPIEGMVGYLANKERLAKAKVSSEQLIGHIKSGCNGYRRLLSNLLEYSRLEHGKKDELIVEPLEIRSFMKQVVEEFQYTARAEHTHIRLLVDSGMPAVVYCDQVKLRQIANNLVHNAIKFVRAGCEVVITVHLQETDRWQLVVINDGGGFPAEQLRKYFHPYQHVRTGINMEGNGLGLFITHKLVEALHGNIEVMRKGVEHTAFEVTLPLEQPCSFSISATG
ncbi:HAMP domain-containing sensor histidine kinase [Paraflavitalea sp. CAU 1676]|uniref:sensor histidine kinase n=1 Tax=Paraflavitalea sp. CAU 1676 TaxID=3032598 RepID=UPI0023DC9F7E|nr:HAMP domain-containing sensor histidine kinase [Paraflavitalea sp. CAU 1676]MDF2188851.1 HAMP domain-containing sensor histidine kinase [Paraflavitalea sp. CAU 1676]